MPHKAKHFEDCIVGGTLPETGTFALVTGTKDSMEVWFFDRKEDIRREWNLAQNEGTNKRFRAYHESTHTGEGDLIADTKRFE